MFSDRLPLAQHYAQLVAGTAVEWGLIGPRETVRLWDRHLVNCAVVAELLPDGARVVDIGSGAGLPGLVLACLRPDLSVDLVDSIARRTTFLSYAASALGFEDRVRVVTGRAEDASVVEQVGAAGWVAARAVAPLARLVSWALPLVVPGGTLLAIKGDRAAQEMAALTGGKRPTRRYSVDLVHCGTGRIARPTSVVRVVRR